MDETTDSEIKIADAEDRQPEAAPDEARPAACQESGTSVWPDPARAKKSSGGRPAKRPAGLREVRVSR